MSITRDPRSGSVVAVCIGSEGQRWKTAVTGGVVVEEHGFQGDRHAGPTRPSHRRPGVMEPNDRHVSVVAREVITEVNLALGLALRPGDLGENLCVEGLGDLADLREGWRLRTERGVVFRVTAQNEPCDNLLAHHRRLLKRLYGRRGVVGVVESGAGRTVLPGDRITLEAPAE